MIKSLKRNQILLTPFVATKQWNISNTSNESLIILESTGSNDGLPVALTFIDYTESSSYVNSNCDIALEQQDSDVIDSVSGLKVVGIFYPDTEPQNFDGTYKRSIYAQVKTMFYNSYVDPTKIWGIENIDFELSKTKRHLSDQFQLINIPRNVFGDVINKNTVVMYDTTQDNDYVITDDGSGNLLAGTNLFSRQQEIGESKNYFVTGSSSYCNSYVSSSF